MTSNRIAGPPSKANQLVTFMEAAKQNEYSSRSFLSLDAHGRVSVVKKQGGMITYIKRLAVRFALAHSKNKDRYHWNEKFGLASDNGTFKAVCAFSNSIEALGKQAPKREGQGQFWLSVDDVISFRADFSDDLARDHKAVYNMAVVARLGYLSDDKDNSEPEPQNEFHKLLVSLELESSPAATRMVEAIVKGYAINATELITEDCISSFVKQYKQLLSYGAKNSSAESGAKLIMVLADNIVEVADTKGEVEQRAERLKEIFICMKDFMEQSSITLNSQAEDFCRLAVLGALGGGAPEPSAGNMAETIKFYAELNFATDVVAYIQKSNQAAEGSKFGFGVLQTIGQSMTTNVSSLTF